MTALVMALDFAAGSPPCLAIVQGFWEGGVLVVWGESETD